MASKTQEATTAAILNSKRPTLLVTEAALQENRERLEAVGLPIAVCPHVPEGVVLLMDMSPPELLRVEPPTLDVSTFSAHSWVIVIAR